MQFQYTPYILPLIVSIIISGWAALYVWPRRAAHGAVALILLALAISEWCAGYALEIASVGLSAKIFWGKMQYVGIVSIPLLWVIFTYFYSIQGNWITRRNVALLSFVPFITLILAFTTELHGLVWNDIHIETADTFSALSFNHGFWFWIYWGYSNILLLAGTYFILRSLARVKGPFLGQRGALLIAVITPWAGNILYVSGLSPIPHMDITPFGFAISVGVFTWGIYRFKLVDLAPVARDVFFEQMSDGFIIIDDANYIVDINPAAARIVGVPISQTIGRAAGDVFSPWPHLIEKFRDTLDAKEEIEVGAGEARRRYQISLSPLYDERNLVTGRAIMLRALSNDSASQIKFAAESIHPLSRTQHEVNGGVDHGSRIERGLESRFPLIRWLINFFSVPIRTDLEIPPGVDPNWYQVSERTFTLILQIAALLAPVVTILARSDFTNFLAGYVAFLTIEFILVILAVVRALPYNLRISGFLFVFYTFGIMETIAFGFSTESFIFFMIVILGAAILSGNRGRWTALAVTLATLVFFYWQIASGYFFPLAMNQNLILSSQLLWPVSVLVSFFASATGLSIAAKTLLEHSRRIWQQETQAKNLLQQERDLLDQRVAERSRDLVEAEVKYRTLVEQMPMVVFRDLADEAGTNTYISPQIETLLGYSPLEWRQDLNFWQNAIHPDDYKLALDTIAETLKRGYSVAEYRMITRDGRIVWVRDEDILIRDASGRPDFVQGILQDITDRKQVEQVLRESEERYRLIAHNAEDIIWTMNMDLQLTYVSPSLERALGYTVDEITNSTLERLLTPASLSIGLGVFNEEVATAQLEPDPQYSRVLQLEYCCKNGSTFWAEMNFSFLRDPLGRPVGVLGVGRDITKRKSTEEALSASQAKFKGVFDAAPDALVIVDREGRIVLSSIQTQKQFGYTEDELSGKPIEILVPERFHHNHLDYRNGFLTNPRIRQMGLGLELFALRKDGSEFPVEVSLSYHNVGDEILVISAIRDITERKLVQEKLRLSEEKYRLIYENLEDVVYQTDYHGFLTAMSPSIKKQAGYEPNELLGQSVLSYYAFPEDYAVLESLIQERGSVNDIEVRLKRKDGSLIFVSLTARTIFDERGQPVGTEGVMRDITERKQAEARILQMNTELENRVRERTSQLQGSNAILSALVETSIALNQSLNLDEVLDRILVEAHKLVPARALNVMFVEGEFVSIVRRFGYMGVEQVERNLTNLRFPLSWPTFQRMRTTGESVWVSDTTKAPDWQNIQSFEWTRSYIGIPLTISGEIVGFLNASDSKPDCFHEEQVKALESLANHASIAIQNARLLEELESALAKEQGMRDQLVHADKLAALGKMVAVIAHEINNPIQTVKNTLYLIEDQIIPNSPGVEYLKMASTEANRISDLIAQLRETYRARSKTFVRVNVLTLLEEVRNLLAPQMKKNQVEWIQDEKLKPCFVFAIRNNLKQVFINLSMNAIEAMSDDHGGRLIINLNLMEESQRVGIVLQNSGPLIPQEALSHIFEPFFTTKGMGSGLGLSICYDIIKQHSGEISVESNSHMGVIFTVWLSIAPGQEAG